MWGELHRRSLKFYNFLKIKSKTEPTEEFKEGAEDFLLN